MAATPTFVKDKATLVMKLEPNSGEMSTPEANDIKFFDVGVSPEIESYIQEFASGRHSKGPAVMGKRKVTFTAKAALLTSDAADEEPKIGRAFQACGLKLTSETNPDDKQVYTPDASKDAGNDVTATIWAILWPSSGSDAIIVKGKGCMGNCVISMDSLGAPLVAEFTFTGALYEIMQGSTIAMSGADTGYAPGTVNSVITIDTGTAVSQQVSKFNLDFGNTVELDPDPEDDTGYAAAYIAKRDPKLMLNVKVKTLSGNDHYARWAGGEQVEFKLITALNNHQLMYSITAPKAQLLTMPLGSREESEMWMWDQTYELHEDTGNDEFSIAMHEEEE